MNDISSTPSILIDGYRWMVAPVRAANALRWKSQACLPIPVLFYHRVADTILNPWTITTRGFAEHLEWLQSRFEIISLSECQRRIGSGTSPRPAMAITFDDGYAENSEFAIPFLLERRIPFTYFVTLANVVEQRPFSHDLEAGSPLPVDSCDSIRALADAGVEIGAHTRTHSDCGKIEDETVLRDEIVVSAEELGAICGRRIRYFAFPFGQPENLNAAGARLARAHGFAGVCSAFGGANRIGDDPFHLKRFHGDPMLARVKNWLAVGRQCGDSPRFEF